MSDDVEAFPALLHTTTPDGVASGASRQLLAYLGAERLEDWLTSVDEAERKSVSESWQRALTSGQPFATEYRLRRADGAQRWMAAHAVPVRGPSGAILRWFHLLSEIEEQKRAEEDLRVGERQLNAILDAIPTIVATHDGAGGFERCNRAAREYYGDGVADPACWKLSDLVHPDDLPALTTARRRSIETGDSMENESRLRRADGVYRRFHVHAFRCDDYDGTSRWYSICTDVHDRRLAEDALRRTEAFLLEVQRLSRTGGWRFDPATGVVESSPEILRTHDVQAGEDPSQPSFWFDRIHPDDRARVQAAFATSLGGMTPYRAGYRITLPDGSVRYVHSTGNPVASDTGELTEFIGATMDMTEHWLAMTELERTAGAIRDLQNRMSRAAQIASVGELAASIAEQLDQPLAAVVASGHDCLRRLGASPPDLPRALEAAGSVVKAGKDAGEIVRRVRGLFKRTAPERESLDANEVIREVLRLLDSYPARREVGIDISLAANLSPLLADRLQLQQLILNLMLNALEALESIGDRARKVSVRSRPNDAGGVAIEITDNGVGLEHPQQAFEAFFTTKANGVGLGLAICRSIVAAHDGQLSAECNVGFGTTFTVTLPAGLP